MKKFRQSFRTRLTGAFLVCALVPLLLCSIGLVQVMKVRVNNQTEQNMTEQMSALTQSLDLIHDGFESAVAQLRENEVLLSALQGGADDDTRVNGQLFLATETLRPYASVHVYDPAGRLRYSTENSVQYQTRSTAWGILYAAKTSDGRIAYRSCQSQPNGTDALLQGAAALEGSSGQICGYLVFEMRQSDFRTLFSGKYGAQGELMLLNSFFRPIYATESSMLSDLAPDLRQQLMTDGAIETASENDFYRIVHHEATDLYLVLQQPQTFNSGTMRMLYAVSITCIALAIVVVFLICIPLSRQISLPIQQLQKAFVKLEKDDLSVRVVKTRDDELGQLAEEFNTMVNALRQNREELVQNQKELDEAQIRLLQAQLNPHFLSNTLDTMKWISKINRVPQVAEMCVNLADILRFCISPEQFVPLYREIEILQRYVGIQKVRLSGSFEFRVELPEELADCIVPKMILQPIVENSMIHGLSGIPDSLILVQVAQAGQMLRITVTDNGHGLPEELAGKPYHRDKAAAGKHLGLYNVDTILSKHYGSGCGLFLDRGPGGVGTCVTATLPVRKEEICNDESFGC